MVVTNILIKIEYSFILTYFQFLFPIVVKHWFVWQTYWYKDVVSGSSIWLYMQYLFVKVCDYYLTLSIKYNTFSLGHTLNITCCWMIMKAFNFMESIFDNTLFNRLIFLIQVSVIGYYHVASISSSFITGCVESPAPKFQFCGLSRWWVFTQNPNIREILSFLSSISYHMITTKFVYLTTVQLSCNVQNFVVVTH